MTEQAAKRCSTCKEWQPTSNFHHSAISPDGRYYRCKECSRKAVAATRRKHVENYLGPTVDDKRCRTCEQVKPSAGFYVNRGNSDGLSRECRPCHRASVRRWYEKKQSTVVS